METEKEFIENGLLEINHIIDSGVNDVRLTEMLKRRYAAQFTPDRGDEEAEFINFWQKNYPNLGHKEWRPIESILNEKGLFTMLKEAFFAGRLPQAKMSEKIKDELKEILDKSGYVDYRNTDFIVELLIDSGFVGSSSKGEEKKPNQFCWNCEAPTKDGALYCCQECMDVHAK